MLIKKNVALFSLIFGVLLVGFVVLKSPGELSLASVFNNVADKFSNLVNPASQVSLPLVSSNDTTPRIAYWWGKVNQHVDPAGFWRPDPDGVSGADLDKLTYCQKWYPQTIGIRDYKVETITNWKRSKYYEQGDYIRVTTSLECIQSGTPPVSYPPINPPTDVAQPQNPPQISLSASPNPSPYNGVTNLSWNISNATNCIASNGWTGTKNANGGYQSIGNMSASTTFVLTCTGPGGSSNASVYVPVSQPISNPPAVFLNASPIPTPYGGIVTLNWNVTDATSCVASNGWTGEKSANSGNQTIGNMTASTTFILTCTGPNGTSSNSVYVPVQQQIQVQNPPINNNNTVFVNSPIDNTQRACPVFTKYLKKGDINNDPQEVRLWQAFLNKYEGFNLVLDGLYGGNTEIAIRAFQTKYRQYVLIPWVISEATGYTYKTTRAYANFLLGCPEGAIILENGNVINFR
ncbi:MAG: peptidoglycan-binding protein [Candidatus Paceibacterota bacterium]